MRKILLYVCMVLGVSMTSCIRTPLPESKDETVMENPAIADAYFEDRIIVRFDDEMTNLIEEDLASGGIMTKSSELNALSENLGVKSMRRLFPHAGEYEKRTRAEGLHRWYVVEYDPALVRTKVSDSFISMPGVEVVEPVARARSTSVATDFFNDPELYRQWHYYNDGSLSSYYVSGEDINVLPVWEKYTVGSDKVIVAVVDYGVDQTHEDLQGNLIGGKNYDNPKLPVQPQSHGTHVAGTIAAVNNNGIGVCGIAGGDASRGIKGVKIWSAQHLGGGNQAAAMKEGADYGAVISQNSWEYVNGGSVSASNKAAIDYFIKYAGCDNEGNQRPDSPMKGGVVIFSSGNQWAGWGNPAGYEPVIAVGSIHHNGKRSPYSNYGDWVDICAPGGDGTTSNVLSTVPGNKYSAAYGTSMAAPHVSGVAALLVSYFGGPGFTNKMLEEKLIKGGRVKEFDKPNGVQLDVLGAFEYGRELPEPVSDESVSVYLNTVTASFKVTADPDNEKAFAYMILAGRDRDALTGLDFRNMPPDVVTGSAMVGEKAVGDDISVTVEGLEFGAEYYVTVVGYDYSRNFSALSAVHEVTTDSNRPPVITTLQEGTLEVESGETVEVTYRVRDPDGHRISVSFDSGSGAASCKQNLNGINVVTIVGDMAAPGLYEARITATDEHGASSKAVLKYELL